MDANTYFVSDNKKTLSLAEFLKILRDVNLGSNYATDDENSAAVNDYTCFNGRTFYRRN